jgi:predicted nucleic acid-binding protein
MTFAAIPNGAAIFLDANAFVVAFSRHAQYGVSCRQLLDRVDRGEIAGMTSTHILSETAHRLMTHEACSAFGWPIASIAQRLKQRPAEVRKLSAYRRAIHDILNSKVQVLAPPPALLLNAANIYNQYGILSNDALLIAIMRANGLTELASSDSDFDQVPGLTRYAPA